MLLAALTCPANPPARVIEGVYVEVDDHDWYRAVNSKSVKEIVIANIVGFDGDSCKNGCDKSDQAIELLDATPEGIRIYVGLVYDANFSVQSADLVAAKAQDVQTAKDFLEKLTDKQKSRISGWYLGREWHNFKSADDQKKLRMYLLDVAKELPAVEEILVAPFFVAKTKTCTTPHDAKGTARMFSDLIAGTKITRILLQDGFGALNERECKWGDDIDAYKPVAQKYAKSVADAMPKNADGKKIEFSTILEAFGDVGKDQCRLDLQFAAVPKGARVIVYEHRACCATGLCQ